MSPRPQAPPLAQAQLLIQAMRQSPEGMFLADPEGRITFANPAFQAVTGRTEAECLGQAIAEVLPGFLWPDPQLATAWNGRVQTGNGQPQTVHLEGSVSPLRDEQGRLIALSGLFRDVSLSVEAERNLVRGDRMEALGALASGVAHDFNNILTAILTAAELIEWQLNPDSGIRPKLQVIYQAVRRAQELNRQILSFSRSSEEKHLPFDLSAVVKEAIFLIKSTFPDNIRLRTEVASSLWITGDPGQAHQVVLNLAINAFQAMQPAGGDLEVTLGERLLETQAPPGRGPEPLTGRYVVLTVKDTGSGIDAAHLARIFDPFFTTKGEQGGSGLGLSVVHGIVQKHMGAMEVQSQPGQGSTFRVLFPLAAQELDRSAPELAPEELGGRERILLVDDEEVLGALGKQGLQLLGYRVTARSDSREALAEFRNHPRDFDLLITDLAMPGLAGVELTNLIQSIRPDLPAILVTGAFQGPPSLEGITTPFADVIYKPVSIQDMARTVRGVMALRPLPDPAPEAPLPGLSAAPADATRVLLAEDSHVTRVLLRTWLAKAGYQVKECQDGLEAWEAFSAARDPAGFDLVLTDIVMPRMDGLQLAARLREVDRDIPIVILSTSEDADSVKAAIHLQVNEFLTKPFNSAVLLDCVKRMGLSRERALKGQRSSETAQAVRMAQRVMEALPERDMPIYSISEPLTDAGGDVFRCHRVEGDSIFFAIADVAGHSVISSYAVAAYLGMLSNFVGECRHLRPADARPGALADGCAPFGTGPCRPLRNLALKLNRTIMTGPFSEVPICSLFGLWNPDCGRLHLLNAGIPHARWFQREWARTVPVELNGTPLGILDEPLMEEQVIAMAPGDRLLLGSDGFFEALSPEQELFQDLLPGLWRDLAVTDIKMAINLVSEAAKAHTLGRFTDDFLVLGLEQPEFDPVHPHFARSLPAGTVQIDQACQELGEWVDHSGAAISASRRFETLLAVREALSNAVLHASPAPDSRVTLLGCRDIRGRLNLAVLDQGLGFDLDAYQPPDTNHSVRGRGIPLIRHFANEVTMTGGELRMTFDVEAPK